MAPLIVSALPHALLATALLALVGCGGPPPNPPNVLMIVVDDMNDWVGSLGGPALTPNIDALARRGTQFTRAYTVSAACNPARTAVMTGQRPETTGQYGNKGNFRDRPGGADRITLPQYLQRHGYETVAAGKVFHRPRGRHDEPFADSDPASWDAQWRGQVGTPGVELYVDEEGWGRWHGGEYRGPMGRMGVWGPVPDAIEETGDWQLSDYCAQYLQEDHDEPFFLACGIFRPHSPQLAPEEFFESYPLDAIALPEDPDADLDDLPPVARHNFSTPFFQEIRKRDEWRKAVQGYLASMSFADHCVGRILDALETSPHRDDTIVVFWSDHGWQLGHKLRWEKFTLWRQSTRVPLIIRLPGSSRAGVQSDRAVSLLDLYPTLVELLGLERPDFLEGESLAPLLRDPTARRRSPAIVTRHDQGGHSVVQGRWNYIRYPDGSEELYDHRNDPAERTNLARNPHRRAIARRLATWLPGVSPGTRP